MALPFLFISFGNHQLAEHLTIEDSVGEGVSQELTWQGLSNQMSTLELGTGSNLFS